jgi:hypothetical protein
VLSCSAAGASTSVSVEAPNRGDTVPVTVEPDPTATGHAAVAYGIEKV